MMMMMMMIMFLLNHTLRFVIILYIGGDLKLILQN